jgi:hypothetical protein
MKKKDDPAKYETYYSDKDKIALDAVLREYEQNAPAEARYKALPPTTCSLFVVLAFRYGGNENTFPIGVFSSRSAAQDAAKRHREYRGGKYDHRIYAFTTDKLDDDVGLHENNKPCVEGMRNLSFSRPL